MTKVRGLDVCVNDDPHQLRRYPTRYPLGADVLRSRTNIRFVSSDVTPGSVLDRPFTASESSAGSNLTNLGDGGRDSR